MPLEETLTFQDVLILIKSVFVKNENHHYFNVFLERCSCQLVKFDSIIKLRFGETKVVKKEFHDAKN